MVKVAFAAEDDKGVESNISAHFGRCPYYVYVEVERGKIKSLEVKKNPFLNVHEPGALPRLMADEGVDVIVAGGMGPRAANLFRTFGIKTIIGVRGTVESALRTLMERGDLKI
ncbi:dinitrogenase iron-molybdenum cofactor biosynthesis protein [Candidatus Bathyarchaeota archaeon]|nr:MAG: dinitrogenase iron-molybdenum cofactor biosynthesis protein [Candidatus Bathyarchaeota archaeon]